MSQCICCGLGLDVQQATCGHWFCVICRGRGHDQPDICVECNPSPLDAAGKDRQGGIQQAKDRQGDTGP